MASVRGCWSAVPLIEISGGGAIIHISSISGLTPSKRTPPYGAVKAALNQYTMTQALDFAPRSIRVNAIAPGLVYTPMVAPRMNDDLRQFRSEAAPLKSEGTRWDVGYAALFLASDEARWITGICLPVDAGLTAVHPGTYTPMNQQTRF